jgi:hypothetical protein
MIPNPNPNLLAQNNTHHMQGIINLCGIWQGIVYPQGVDLDPPK